MGSPTFGTTRPGAPVSLIIAETPTALSVSRLTWEPSGAASVILPTTPSPTITGSLICTPAAVPWLMTIVEFHRFGDLPVTVAVTGW